MGCEFGVCFICAVVECDVPARGGLEHQRAVGGTADVDVAVCGIEEHECAEFVVGVGQGIVEEVNELVVTQFESRDAVVVRGAIGLIIDLGMRHHHEVDRRRVRKNGGAYHRGQDGAARPVHPGEFE